MPDVLISLDRHKPFRIIIRAFNRKREIILAFSIQSGNKKRLSTPEDVKDSQPA